MWNEREIFFVKKMPQRKSVKYLFPEGEKQTEARRRRRKITEQKKKYTKTATADMDMSELRKMAKSKGIEVLGYNKTQLINEINRR